MRSHEDVAAVLLGILRANLNDSALELDPRTRPENVAGWDSIKMVDIILDSEDAFGIRLDAADLDRIHCVGDLIDRVRARLDAS